MNLKKGTNMSRYFEDPYNHAIFDIRELIFGFSNVAGIQNNRCLDHYQKINNSFITRKRILDNSHIPLYLVQTLSDLALYDAMDEYEFKRGSIIKNVVTTEGENEISFGIALKHQGEVIDYFYIDVETDDKKYLFIETFEQALTELKTCHAEEVWKR